MVLFVEQSIIKLGNFIHKYFFIILLSLSMSTLVYSQKKLNSKKDPEVKEKTLRVQKFIPTDTSSVFELPKIDFKNINLIVDYYKPAKLAEIERLKRNKQWDEFMLKLYDYVSNFGIKNFIYDLDKVWMLARVAEAQGQMELTKELYRVLIKHYRGDLQQALHYYDSIAHYDKVLYADIEDYYRLIEKRKQIDTLMPPKDIMLEMGDGVNSPYDDYGLTISGEYDDLIIFTSSRNIDTVRYKLDIGNVRQNEDIYISKKDIALDEWGKAEPFKALNSEDNEGSPCMSRDGRHIVFARCNSEDGLGDCDLYITNLENDSVWSEPKNLGANVNSYAWDSHPAFSISGDTLFFSSSRRGGFGGTDIYYSIKDQKTGDWEKAQNIGPIINTRDSEVSPYPHPKYNVLYFSSNGHMLNFGDFDIFKTYRVENSWTEPYNVGPLVNGEGNEFYFTIDSESKWLFYAKSVGPEEENLDLQSFPLPMDAKPNSVVKFRGRIIEPTTGEVFQGVVTVIDMDEGDEVAPRKTYADGSFEFELIDKRNYLIIVEGDNFFDIEQVFYLEGDTTMDIEATDAASTISFESIDFEKGSSTLQPIMENNLHLIIDFLSDHPNFNLKIVGHTDSDGNPEDNFNLSLERAKVIRDYIISYGLFDNDRVQAYGLGSSQPLIENEITEEDKKKNRRVEFNLYHVNPKDSKTE
ncbi:OmpA family protein [Chondrinema litorale]|uniref:OmpA family protein n=1 Tax=Chondrinema litorale TaxID=2994555 RepID=UPI002543BB7C|nr:OmpA family protein [Chondrinema litorale]UZR94274.1 OmpA family protein [Chondrinema litorale]